MWHHKPLALAAPPLPSGTLLRIPPLARLCLLYAAHRFLLSSCPPQGTHGRTRVGCSLEAILLFLSSSAQSLHQQRS